MPKLLRLESLFNINVIRLCIGLTVGSVRLYKTVAAGTKSRGLVKGLDYLLDARLNKGTCFSLEERISLGIHGLLPGQVRSQDEQLEKVEFSLQQTPDPLQKFFYLLDLLDRNEKLFYRYFSENIRAALPIVYTPTVGLACLKYGLLYKRPRGLYITHHDSGHIQEILNNWSEPNVKAVCVTDGERILGLGDLGANGMGIPVGKLSLYTALAGVFPYECLPIMLDVGTNNKKLRNSPLYVGLKEKRHSGPKYEEFVDEFMEAVVQRYGRTTLIQFEDFATPNAYKFLSKYRDKYCMFNDDIQGTAAVVLAGILASGRITGRCMSDETILIVGAGAGLGVAKLSVVSLMEQGLSEEDALSKIYLVDADGLLTVDRCDCLTEHEKPFVKDIEPIDDLVEIVETVKPTIMLGATGVGGLFNEEVLHAMAEINEHPVIFALSNPTHMAECTAEDAYKFTDGRVIFSSGSPFADVKVNGKTFRPGQANNAYIFPGVALGIIRSGIYHVPEEMFTLAAQSLAAQVTDEDLEARSLYPPLECIMEVSRQIATEVIEYSYQNGLSSLYPKPKNIYKWLKTKVYSFEYESTMPTQYKWPTET